MIIQHVDSNREINANVEILSIFHWSNNNVLRKSDTESVLRWDMEWSQFFVPRVRNKDSIHQRKMFNGYLENKAGVWETKGRYAGLEICVELEFELESVAVIFSVSCFSHYWLFAFLTPFTPRGGYRTHFQPWKCISQLLPPQCWVTNHPKTQWLVFLYIFLTHGSVGLQQYEYSLSGPDLKADLKSQAESRSSLGVFYPPRTRGFLGHVLLMVNYIRIRGWRWGQLWKHILSFCSHHIP